MIEKSFNAMAEYTCTVLFEAVEEGGFAVIAVTRVTYWTKL
jgi:hypothetical protein